MPRNLLTDIATASRLDLDRPSIAAVERRFGVMAQRDPRLQRAIGLGVGLIIVAGLLAGTATIRLSRAAGLWQPWDILFAAVLTPLVLAGAWFAVFPLMTRRATRRALRACGHDVCEGCGYVLDGLPRGGACPECGRREQSPLGEVDAAGDAAG